ncbi:protein O-mannosyltransferase [Mycobacteroides abscessus]|nr:protein O-mannosyltransferase [Mycobacteroides abscessus]
MYFFYATPMVPFLVMMIAFIIGDFLRKPTDNPERKKLRMFIATFYLALVVTNFAWLYPILTGAAISPFMWNMEMWLPSWR